MLSLDYVVNGNKLLLKGINELDIDEEELKPLAFNKHDSCKYFEDEEELNKWIRDYMKSGYKVRIAPNYYGRAAFVTADGISFACSGLNGGDNMKIDVTKLEAFIKENKQVEYYYLLADGKIVTIGVDSDKYIPWCFPNEEDALRFARDFTKRLGRTEHYQCIKTLNKIESWL